MTKLVKMAMDGDARLMAILVDRLVPKIQRHELEAADSPTKIVLEFQKAEPAAIGKGCSRAAG